MATEPRNFRASLEDIDKAIRAYNENTGKLTKAEAAVTELRRQRAELTRRLMTIHKAASELRALTNNPSTKNAVVDKATASKENRHVLGTPIEG